MKSSQICQDCGMMFQTAIQLTNHKKKFCINSKYGQLQELQKNFQSVSKNRDISKFGKMSLAKQGRTYDFEKNQQNTNKLDEEYRKILKQIQDQKNIKNKLQVQKQKAFRQLQALQKQQEQLIIDDKRNNLQDIISRREALAREQEQLQKQIKQYQSKKKQWEKSQVKNKQAIDQPYEQGLKAGKLSFQKAMLEQRKNNIQMQLNAKKREKQKLQKNLLQMSAVQQIEPFSKASKTLIKSPARSMAGIKVSEPQSYNNSQVKPQIDYSKLNNDRPDRPRTQISQASQSSKLSSYLSPGALDGTQKILKFNLNKQGKSQQDKLIQSIMAQQYDDLLILSKLPKGSQLYNMKMKQYTQLSKYRMQVQQKAQKQRIDKMKKQFQFEKIMNQKEKQNNQWVDQNRKAFMSKQVDIIRNAQSENYANNPQTSHSIVMPNYSQSNMRNIPSGVQIPNGVNRPSIAPNIPGLGTNPNMQASPYQPVNRNDKKKDPFGYRISVLFLRNYSLKRAIKIKLIIYEQYYHEKDMGMKYQFATIYHQQKSDQDPFNPQSKNKLDATGAIAYNESFYISQNLQQLYNRNQKQIYLLIILAQKDEKRVTNQPKPYCWYSFKITHFGQIKEGRFTVNLYGDDILYPYPADMNKMKKKKQQQLTFEVQQVLLDQQILQSLKKPLSKPNIPSNQSIPNQNPNQTKMSNKSNNSLGNQPRQQSGSQIPSKNSKPSFENIPKEGSNKVNNNNDTTSMNYPLKLKNIDQDDTIKNVKQEYFYSNEKPTQFSHVQLKKPLNFDVSVSGLRTLPSYIGPVKLQISFLDIDSSHILPKQQFLAQVSTDLYNPLVQFTKKIRNQTKIPPSTIIFIRMIAISAMDYQVYSLGFTLIYLFLDKQGQPIKTNKITDYLMTSGYYQLPIFWGNIQPRYMDIQQLLTNYPPIPCASILIGILQNASKISNPMPLYSQKIYNTILFQIDDNQAKLFQQQYKRQPIDTNTLISGYLQYKGIKKNYSGQQITKYLYKTLIFSNQNVKQKLELKWMAEYLEQFGINFVIDKLFVPQQQLKYYYFITVCISPPANYYKKKNFDLNFCRKINFNNSTTTQFTFEDNQFFLNPAYFKNASIIIEINRIQIFQSENTQADNNIQGFAYIVIPLFQIQQQIRAVNVMQANLPLFQGDFDANNIQKLQKNLPSFLDKNQKNKKSKAQISIRMLNGYFMNQFQPNLPVIKPKGTKMYKDIAPQNMSFQDALQDIASILSSNYNLQVT